MKQDGVDRIMENENINTLKTKLYNIEHNYGHDKNSFEFPIIFKYWAFLIHNMMELTDKRYKLLRETLPTRKTFLQILMHLQNIAFENWEKLLKYMIEGLELIDPRD